MGQASEEHLPPDLRGRGGVGGAAKENRGSALARVAAQNAAGSAPQEEDKTETAEVEEKDADPKLATCPRCEVKVSEDNNFCGNCGRDLGQDPVAQLGIKFADEDLDEYIFRGFVVKTVKVIGKQLVVRSSMAEDHKGISDYLMAEWGEKSVTNDFWENIRGAASISSCIVSFDGTNIGETLSDKVEWMMKTGSALHDMISQRVVLYNRAVTEWLNKKNTFLAS